MKTEFEWRVIDQEGKKLDGNTGIRGDYFDPIMIYAQIPMERKKFLELTNECKNNKTSIYDLLEIALNPDPEEIDLF